jgi:hypothetical protein
MKDLARRWHSAGVWHILQCKETPDGYARAMPHEADIPEIRQIFLSATAQDCATYREAVRDFVQDNIEAAKVFLQENWAEGGQFRRPVCKRKVDECDAYIGLFGHRYGWTPPLHALHHRTGVPLGGGSLGAGRGADLCAAPGKRQRGRPAPADGPPCSSTRVPGRRRADRHAQRQVSCQRSISGPPTGVSRSSTATPCSWSARPCRASRTGTRRCSATARERFKAPGDIPRNELGRIGRDEQIAALKSALNVSASAGTAGAAFFVHGPENHGQREFAEFLCALARRVGGHGPLLWSAAEPDSIES